MEMIIIDDVRLFNFPKLEEMEVGFSNFYEDNIKMRELLMYYE